MLKMNDLSPQPPFYREPEATGTHQFDLPTLVAIARKQWPTIVAAVLICVLGAVAYLMTATPLYTASTRILIDTRKNQLLQNQQVIGDQTVDSGVVESQVEILKSESVALAVVRDLNLTKDREFLGSGGGIMSSIMSAIAGMTSGSSGGPTAESGGVSNAERGAVATVVNNIAAKRVGLTYVVEVSYTALSPTVAARVANAVADAYMVGELEAKYQATKRASKWLQDRIGELREQATAAERAVQSFKASNNIVDTSRGLISEQQLSDVNGQLILARAATAEAKARLDRIDQVIADDTVPDASVSDSLHSDVINRLRAQFLDQSARENDFSAKYGVNHSATINLRNQMHEIRRSIASEMQRIAQTFKNDYEVAQAREKSLEASLGKLVDENGLGGQARVKLRDLESSAQTYRNLYDNFLQKFMEATQQQTFPIVEARVITAATPPGGKSAPKAPSIFGGALLFGLFAGFAIAVGREVLNKSFLTVADVEKGIGYECLGILPTISSNESDANQKGAAFSRFVVQSPFSRFAETLRNVKVSVDLARLTRDMKVIGIVSSVPREGKTTVASNLAQLTANAGHRTLLIDADLRNPNLTRTQGGNAEFGLLDVLSRGKTIAEVVIVDATTGMHFLPAIVPSRVSNAAELLSSDAMSQLLADARGRYEYIFLDFAPVGPVVDVKAASHLVDGFVYVIEWGKTSNQGVKEALASADQMRDRLLGAILNKADPSVLKRHEGYKGSHYQRYYVEGNVSGA